MKQLFHKGLYKEGLRQTTLPAIIYFCLVELFALVISIGNVIYTRDNHEATGGAQVTMLGSVSINPLYMLSFTLFIPLITLVGFSFLNARNKSDFFHSMPHKRQTIFFSYVLAILTWLVVILAVSLLTSLCIYFVNAKYFSINFRSIFTYLFNVFAACLLVLGAGLIGMSVTGTIFSNLITAALILFLPRTIMTIFLKAVTSRAPVLAASNSGLLMDPGYNLPFGLVSSFLLGNVSMEDLFGEARYGLYTLILGLLYLAAACILFTLRKSETAGTSALSRRTQSIIRVALSFFVSALACAALLLDDVPTTGIILFALALLVYFAYEAITSRTFKTIPKTIPGLGVLVGLNIVFLLGVTLSSGYILGMKWDAKNIESVSISYREDPYSPPSYEDYRMSDTKITDPALLEQTAILLTENQELAKLERGNMYYNASLQHVIIRMKNGKTHHRSLYFSNAENQGFQQALLSSDFTEKVFSDVPENPASITAYSQSNIPFTEEQTKQIYETFRQEVEAMGFQKWGQFMLSSGLLSGTFGAGLQRTSYETDYAGSSVMAAEASSDRLAVPDDRLPQANIDISGHYGTKQYYGNYTIARQITPKTLALIYKLSNENTLPDLRASWADYETNGLRDYDDPGISMESQEEMSAVNSLSFSGAQADSDVSIALSQYAGGYGDPAGSIPEELLRLTKQKIDEGQTEVDFTKPVLTLAMDSYSFTEKNGERYVVNYLSRTYSFNITEEELNRFANIA